VVSSAERGKFMSLNSSFQQLFTGLASLISGLIVYHDEFGKIYNYKWVGYCSIFVIFCMVFIGSLLAKKQNLK
jgi:hypothetical protein